MNKTLPTSFLAGIAATAVMTLVMMVAPMMGFPPMNPAAMLSGMIGSPLVVGWIMHFMIGVIFALSYSFLFLPRVAISNAIIKGAVFGFAVFVFAQIAIAMMGALMSGIPPAEGNMALMLLGSIVGHLVFGIVVGLIAKPSR